MAQLGSAPDWGLGVAVFGLVILAVFLGVFAHRGLNNIKIFKKTTQMAN
tara:strand:- start:386 stop:532 length:147 start_codon:yes stop_codon:yes gene_type:complete